MHAAFQEHVDAAVSKTVNLPTDASSQAVREIFLTAHELRLKGVTVYRYGSRLGQTLNIVDDSERRIAGNARCKGERRMADSRKIISDAAAAERGANEHVRPPE